MAKKRRRREDDDGEEPDAPQKSVKFDPALTTREDPDEVHDDDEPAPGEAVDKGSRLTREEDDEEEVAAPRRDGAMAGTDDAVDVKIVGGRITKVEGEEDETLDENFEEGGIKIVPFNLKAERETGHFDESGHYVDNKFVEDRDAWFDELDEAEKELKKQGKDPKPVKQVEIADFDEEDEVDLVALKETIVEILQPKEEVRQALKRLRGSGKKPSAEGGEAFNRLMEAANSLLQSGVFGIYNQSKESIQEELEAAEKEADEGLWDYKLTEDGEEHGPFTTAQMASWAEQGYFSSESPALVRMRDPRKVLEDIPFQPSTEVDFAAYADLMDL